MARSRKGPTFPGLRAGARLRQPYLVEKPAFRRRVPWAPNLSQRAMRGKSGLATGKTTSCYDAPGGKSVHWQANLASPPRDMPVESFYRHVKVLFGSVPIRVTSSMNRQVSDGCGWGWSLDGLAIWDRYAPSVSWAVGPLPSFGRLHGTSRPREANANGRAIRGGQTRPAASRLPTARLQRPGRGPPSRRTWRSRGLPESDDGHGDGHSGP